MAIMAPCSPNVVIANQVTAPALIDIGISDANAAVSAESIPITVQAMGAGDVEVWTHGTKATTLSNAGGGKFIGTLNLSAEPAGPLHVSFKAFDVAPPAIPALHLEGQYTLFIAGTRPAIPTPAPAVGMTLAFSDHFTTLSATPCKPGTGTWPNCTAPSAADGFTWYENQFNGKDYGDCANEHTDGSHNPFTILPQGGLRIRNQYDSTYTDPYGFGRTQYCGTTSMSVVGDGYYDARVLVPNGECGSPGNNTCSGGTWPSFWMLSMNNPQGALELDMMEMYGNDPTYFQGFTHAYSPAFFPASGGGASTHDGDLTWDWHTVGMLVDRLRNTHRDCLQLFR
jgi:hypothetical protein